jgi:histidyl-tRNA synthetase
VSDRVKFQAVRGTRDILPPDTGLWNRIEQVARDVFSTYRFGEIRLPIFEETELFARSIGQETDVVSKEMYTFEDYDIPELPELRSAVLAWQHANENPQDYLEFQTRIASYMHRARTAFENAEIPRTPENKLALDDVDFLRSVLGTMLHQPESDKRSKVAEIKERIRQVKFGDSLTLRPEATASVCRAYIQHGMKTWPQPVRLYYIGPMFRRERPQKGRYRQFYQIGAEILSQSDSSDIDAEVIQMVMGFFGRVGLSESKLYINSIGDKTCRAKYVEKLRKALRGVTDRLGADSQRRIETNPLRVLDSKVPSEQSAIETLPRIAESLCDACTEHFANVQHELTLRGIEFEINWRLVRGLDYYTRTTFEVIAPGLGTQDAVCGGGRYDGLVEMLGGSPTKGFGFAIGLDRLVLSIESSSLAVSVESPNIVVIPTSDQTWDKAVQLTSFLRGKGLSILLPRKGASVNGTLQSAQKLNVRVAIFVGDTELRQVPYTIRLLRSIEPNSPREIRVEHQDVLMYGKIVKLRQDIEKALFRLRTPRSDSEAEGNISVLIDRLVRDKRIPPMTAGEIRNVLPVINSAIHGKADLSGDSVQWAIAFGNLLLSELETLGPGKG